VRKVTDTRVALSWIRDGREETLTIEGKASLEEVERLRI